MMLKILGALLLVAAGTAVGYERSLSAKKRAAVLADLVTVLGIMRDEIEILSSPLPALFSRLAAAGPKSLQSFFEGLCGAVLEDGLQSAWDKQAAALDIGQEAKNILCSMGTSLGRYGAEQQGCEIELVRKRLLQLLEEARCERSRCAKLYPGLGASLGAMLAIILL